MKPKSSVILQPICLLIALVLMVLLIPIVLVTIWYVMTTRVEHTIEKVFQNDSLSEIRIIERSSYAFSSSALDLARVLSASLNGTDFSFSTVETKVAPCLFRAFSTISNLSQISYIGRDGLVFSYVRDANQTFAIYSNISHSSTAVTPNAAVTSWYKQFVNSNSGKRYGEAKCMNPVVNVDGSWYQEALSNANGYKLGNKWSEDQTLLLLRTAAMDGIGVVSLGFSLVDIMNFFSIIHSHDGQLHLATGNGDRLAHSGALSNKLIEQTGYSTSQVHLCAISLGRFIGLVRRNSKLALPLLLATFLSMVISFFFVLFLIIRTARREVLLRAKLIKQMEATRQAERESKNKSLAFASASHDLRAALAIITGLIGFCNEVVHPKSELKTNLVQISECVKDLSGILNSILDTSKVEAGMMQLVEEEFNLVELLEYVADLYYNAGLRKDIDVVLDPCDDSIFKFSIVKGDHEKLKRILSNLLSNAVKFTDEGHVSLRAWVKKPSLENSVLDSNHDSMWGCLPRLVYKNKKAYNDFSVLHPIQQNPNTMEFVFEVDDTGKGIPKEKQSYVFENFVQVKETALEQEGHGLGLGIVQSLVHLMGGKIEIMEKEHGERGTCFRFNILLTKCGAATVNSTGEENTLQNSHISNELSQNSGLHIRCQASKLFGSSHVVLLIQSDERRRISQRIIESLGVSVSTVNRWEHLFPTLEKIKCRLNLNCFSSSGKSEYGSPVDHRSRVPTKDGSDLNPTPHKKQGFRNITFLLLVIDADIEHFSDMHSGITNFNRELKDGCCKVIWLDKPMIGISHAKGLQEDNLAHYEYVVSKPLHGSRLYELLRILPEFKGNVEGDLLRKEPETQIDLDPGPTTRKPYHKSKSQLLKSQHEYSPQKGNDKLLTGKKVLVAEDVEVLRQIAIAVLSRLGATVDSCVNGKEALEKVSRALSGINSSTNAADRTLPYDIIFMDCEMPIMDGYEATTRIRREERRYGGIPIPIAALTAHARGEVEETKILQSGMDFHLTKPLEKDQVLSLLQKRSL